MHGQVNAEGWKAVPCCYKWDEPMQAFKWAVFSIQLNLKTCWRCMFISADDWSCYPGLKINIPLCIKANLRCKLTKEENKCVEQVPFSNWLKIHYIARLSIKLVPLLPEGLLCFTKDLGTPCLLCLAIAGLFGFPSTTTTKDLFRGKTSLALFKSPEQEFIRI